MPRKSIKEGYKVWEICEADYLYYFMFASRANGTGELILEKSLTPTTSMVFQIVHQLPKSSNTLIIFLDSFFTLISLFLKLQSENIGAVGKTRLNTAREDFSAILHVLKEKYGTVCDTFFTKLTIKTN